jgi:hypothetical protein
MPSIILAKRQGACDKHLAVVKLYKDLFRLGLKEASEQIYYLEHQKAYEIPVTEADLLTAAHFVYAVRKLGLNCELRSGLEKVVSRRGNKKAPPAMVGLGDNGLSVHY